jgi:hypothetical protein
MLPLQAERWNVLAYDRFAGFAGEHVFLLMEPERLHQTGGQALQVRTISYCVSAICAYSVSPGRQQRMHRHCFEFLGGFGCGVFCLCSWSKLCRKECVPFTRFSVASLSKLLSQLCVDGEQRPVVYRLWDGQCGVAVYAVVTGFVGYRLVRWVLPSPAFWPLNPPSTPAVSSLIIYQLPRLGMMGVCGAASSVKRFVGTRATPAVVVT